ncbi:hypothetical protein MMC10_004385 [Thelotrema lepadinum]|nr:hypothetical protein [Thelotrema lepadinum]
MAGKALRIRLDQNQRVWHPSQTVSGNVRLEATEQVNVDNIQIVFEGRAKSKVKRSSGNSSTTYRGRVVFFRKAQLLFKGPFTLKPGNMEWPFQFQIPKDARGYSGRAGGDMFRYPHLVRNQFVDQLEQPLPPSMHRQSFGFGDQKECYVSYRLSAALKVTDTFRSNRDCYATLELQPYRTVATPNIEYLRTLHQFTIQSLHLNPEVSDRSLKFKEKMTTLFSPTKLPMSKFAVRLELPRSAIANQPMRIRLFLEHNVEHSTAPELPLVHLKKITLTFTEKIMTMVKASHLFSDDDDRDVFTNKKPFVSWEGSVPIMECLDLTSALKRQLYGPNYVPTFKTYNIALDYSLLAEFKLECAQQRETFAASVPTFFLHGSKYQDTGPEESSTSVEPPPWKPSEEEEQLPAYSAD